jgi:putative addiction module CopG family antidote
MQSGENAQNQLKMSPQKHFQANGWSDTLIARSNAMADLKLNPKTIERIQDMVDSGLYRDANDVVRAALKALETREREQAAFKQSLIDADAEIDRTGGIPFTPERFELMKQRAKEKLLAGNQPRRDVRP